MDDKGFEGINIIPLVDVMLVLLTIVLTTSTFIAAGVIPLALPQTKNASAIENQSVLTIDLDARGTCYLRNQPLTLAQLRAALSRQERQQPILIRADKTIALQLFVEIMDLVKGLGFSKISLETERS